MCLGTFQLDIPAVFSQLINVWVFRVVFVVVVEMCDAWQVDKLHKQGSKLPQDADMTFERWHSTGNVHF